MKVPHNIAPKQLHFINMKIDTGAMGNTLPLRIFQQMMPDNMKHQDGTPRGCDNRKEIELTAYNDTSIKCYGSIKMNCKWGPSEWEEFEFYIVDVKGHAACGLPMAEALGIVKINDRAQQTAHSRQEINIIKTEKQQQEPVKIKTIADLKNLYPNQFDKIGNLPGKAKIYQKADAVPFIDAPRKYSRKNKN